MHKKLLFKAYENKKTFSKIASGKCFFVSSGILLPGIGNDEVFCPYRKL